jgi:diketogulonate reductase-like aldo/keto reductase
MTKAAPEWLPEIRAFCRQAGINLMAWGPNMLTVEARSPEKAKEIAHQLGQLGFQVVEDEADAAAGMLSLSRNPDAVRAQIAAFNQKNNT